MNFILPYLPLNLFDEVLVNNLNIYSIEKTITIVVYIKYKTL
jgi:hypothetical protein